MHQSQLEESLAERRIALSALWRIAPALLQPVLVVSAIFWARIESIALHPAASDINPPTVSRAIADPAIGDIFANLAIAAAVLQSFAVWRIVRALTRTTEGGTAQVLLLLMVGAQGVAICGMIVLTQYTGPISDSLHTLGSYMLFAGQGVGIPLSGIFFYRDDGRRRALGLSAPNNSPAPYDARFHPPFAALIFVLALVFGFLYFDPAYIQGWNDYGYRVAFAFVEIALLVSFEVYLASFIGPMYRYERYMLGSLHPR